MTNPVPPATTTSVLPFSAWQLIDNWRDWWRFWSVRIQAAGAAVTGPTVIAWLVGAVHNEWIVGGVLIFSFLCHISSPPARLVKQGNVPSVSDLNEAQVGVLPRSNLPAPAVPWKVPTEMARQVAAFRTPFNPPA